MRRVPLGLTKECTTDDETGARVVLSPGRVYRGNVYNKYDAEYKRRKDVGDEVQSVELADIERQLREALD